MKTSQKGIEEIVKREGLRTKAYKDSVGVWTIGIGHTSAAGLPKVTPGLVLTKQECIDLLTKDIVQYENAVNKAVKVTITQNQFDALVSFAYNVGSAGMARSTAIKLLNKGNPAAAAKALMAWTKPPEITGRRRSEMEQFLTPYTGVPAGNKTATGAVVVATGTIGALATTPHHYWPWIIAGGVAAAIVGYVALSIHEFRKTQTDVG